MAKTEKDIAREVKAMTRKEVLLKALEGRIRWSQAADILGMTARNVRRLRWKMETFGIEALNDGRSAASNANPGGDGGGNAAVTAREVPRFFGEALS